MVPGDAKRLLATALKLGEKNLDELLTLRRVCRRALQLLDTGRVRDAHGLLEQALLEKRR